MRQFIAGALLAIAARLLRAPSLATVASQQPLETTVPQPVTDEIAPMVPPPAHEHAEGAAHLATWCPECRFTIAVISDAFANDAYDATAARHAMRSLSLLGFGAQLETCPFHVQPHPSPALSRQ